MISDVTASAHFSHAINIVRKFCSMANNKSEYCIFIISLEEINRNATERREECESCWKCKIIISFLSLATKTGKLDEKTKRATFNNIKTANRTILAWENFGSWFFFCNVCAGSSRNKYTPCYMDSLELDSLTQIVSNSSTCTHSHSYSLHTFIVWVIILFYNYEVTTVFLSLSFSILFFWGVSCSTAGKIYW